MTIDQDKRRARWKRNKRSQRLRKKPTPIPLNPDFERKVWEERDRRAVSAYRGTWCWPEYPYLSEERLRRAVGLVADVWALDVLFVARWGAEKASPTLIYEALKLAGRTHGYTDGSLRKMITKARERIRLLETSSWPWQADEVFWPPFNTTY